MWLIVTALVVLVVAIIVLTMFTNVAVSISRFAESCRTSAAVTCQSGSLPVGWDSARIRTDSGDRTCLEATGIKDCSIFTAK